MLKRLLSCCVLVMCFIFPSFADDECPAGYQLVDYVELEYIESTGTQYIDTGISVGLTDLLYTDTKYSYTRASSESYLLGTNSNLSQNRLTLVACYQTKHLFGFGDWAQGDNIISTDTIYRAETLTTNGSQTFTYNNVSYNKTWTQTSPFLSNLLLFPTLEYPRNFRASAKVYYLIVKKNNVLVRNFIPAKRNSDGAVGMYDTVSQTFFTNAGTGNFIAGPEVQSFIVDGNGDIDCMSCPANTYKPNTGNESCTKCPEHTFSPIGSTSLDQCGHILHVGDYIAFMPVGKRTEHGLCTMLGGVKYCADLYERQ